MKRSTAILYAIVFGFFTTVFAFLTGCCIAERRWLPLITCLALLGSSALMLFAALQDATKASNDAEGGDANPEGEQ